MFKEQQSPGNSWYLNRKKIFLNELNAFIDLKYPSAFSKKLKEWIFAHFHKEMGILCKARDELGRAFLFKNLEERKLLKRNLGKLRQDLHKQYLIFHVLSANSQDEIKKDFRYAALPVKLHLLEKLKEFRKNKEHTSEIVQNLLILNYKSSDFDQINAISLQECFPIDEYHPKSIFII